ncbi:DNA-binding MarR family transcriptional regulator [Paraburkholderia sp. GAS199]|uniref:MarR family winged helix-turn-helix transcriptional regulator n=1 Tax=Paraburkholderia sp. GAS199 TaxID=3035126 RepID=UPI003D2388EC
MSLTPICTKPDPASPDHPINESVGYLIARVQSQLNQMVTQRTLANLGVTATQASMLFMLAIGRCTTAAELAREYAIDASAVTRLLDRVEKRGLLSRMRSVKDRRVVQLSLTNSGRELANQIPEIFTQALDRAVLGFTPEEVGFLKSMLRRLYANCNDEGLEILPRY